MVKKVLRPQDAARILFDDIKQDPEKLRKLSGTYTPLGDFYMGNRICCNVYGLSLSGPHDVSNAELHEKVLARLEIELTAEDLEDFPSTMRVQEQLGRLVKNELSDYL